MFENFNIKIALKPNNNISKVKLPKPLEEKTDVHKIVCDEKGKISSNF